MSAIKVVAAYLLIGSIMTGFMIASHANRCGTLKGLHDADLYGGIFAGPYVVVAVLVAVAATHDAESLNSTQSCE